MFKLEFTTDGSAFDDENDGYAVGEIRDILMSVAGKVYDGDTEGVIRASNSNGPAIGKWSFERD